MKKTILGALFFSFTAVVSAQQMPGCVDLPYGLSRGMENSHVLALQNFLFAKGFLKATPNGYFGPATFAAVKALQKSAGFSQVGVAGPATRAYIKASTCQTEGVYQAIPSGNQPGTSSQQSYSAPTPPSVAIPRPQLDSVDLVTIFSGGQTDWGFDLHGSNFSSTTNAVYFRNLGNSMVYAIGTFESATGTIISLPANIGNTKFSCGNGCFQILSPGTYEIYVTTPGGQSAGKYMEIRSFTIHSQTGTVWTSLPATSESAKLGSVSFSAPVPVIVRAVSLMVSTSTISSDGLSVVSYYDPVRREAFAVDAEFWAFQTMIVEANVATSNTIPGTVSAYFTVEIEDYIGKRKTTFTSPEFLATVAGLI